MTHKFSTATDDMPDSEFVASCKACVIVFVDGQCNQFCLYPTAPTEDELTALREELATDNELGLVGIDTNRITFRTILK
jgi:hypothetical protein